MSIYQAVVTIEYSGASGGPGVNVWNHRFGQGVPVQADLDTAGDALEAFYNQIKGIYPAGVQIRWDGVWDRVDNSDDGGGGL